MSSRDPSPRARALALLAALAWAASACGDERPAADASVADAPPPPVDAPVAPAELVVGTWNLYNYSIFGATDARTAAIATTIEGLGADVVAVQELKVREGTAGEPPQAWDALLEALPGHDGVHAPWDTFDTTVGLLYRADTTTLVGAQTIFEGDRWAFPRPPLHATVRIDKGGASETFHIIVVHLKAFDDSVDRRQRACELLRGYIDGRADRAFVVLGDFNDDPYDPPTLNSFRGTFLGEEPAYHFVTATLPPESVTSTGWHHYVGGTQIEGEFLDHAVFTGDLFDRFTSVEPEIHGRPPAEFDAWIRAASDHFPVVVRMRR